MIKGYICKLKCLIGSSSAPPHGYILGSSKVMTRYLQFLLDRGTDVNTKVGILGTALQEASYAGHVNVVQILLFIVSKLD
jgi:hypothetical protein